MSTQLDIQKSVNNIGIRIYSFHGELDAVNVDDTFWDIARDIWDFTNARIVFNFIGLTYINSKWLGWLADIAERAKNGNGKLVICNPLPEILDTLEISGLGNVIPFCENERVANEQFLN